MGRRIPRFWHMHQLDLFTKADAALVSVSALLALLASYHLNHLALEETNPKITPEFNLEEGAGAALFEYLKARHGVADAQSVDASMGFELGLEVAAAIINPGLDARQSAKQIATALSAAVDPLFVVPAALPASSTPSRVCSHGRRLFRRGPLR